MHKSTLRYVKGGVSFLDENDIVLFNAVMRKIYEVVESENPEHYKNLKKPMNEYKRVHVRGSAVLLFKYNKKNQIIYFSRLDHHDNIYK